MTAQASNVRAETFNSGSAAAQKTLTADGAGGAAWKWGNRPVFNPMDYGAVGDGTTDDAAAIVAAHTAIPTGGGIIYLPPGKTFLIGSTVTISKDGVTLDASRSTVKKANTFTATPAFTVSGSNVQIHRLLLEGNRVGGALGVGISWSGSGGVLESSIVQNCKSHGVWLTAGSLTCRRCIATGNYSGVAAGTAGFVASGGILICDDCESTLNDSYGYNISSAAGVCQFRGTCRSSRNGVIGLLIASNSGHIEDFRSYDEGLDSVNVIGVNLYSSSATAGAQASDWTVDYLEVVDCGKTIGGGNATALALNGGQHNRFGTVVIVRPTSYGVSIGRNSTNPSVGSWYNQFGSIFVDRLGAPYSGDSGVTIAGDASYNTFTDVSVLGGNIGVMIGDDVLPAPTPTNPINVNIHNRIDSLYVQGCAYGACVINVGRYNHIGKIVSRNNYNTDATLAKGIVSFFPSRATGVIAGLAAHASWVVGNTISQVDHKTESGTKPTYVVYADGYANANQVLEVRHRGDFVTAGEFDASGVGQNRLSDYNRLAYSAAITPDASMGHKVFQIDATNGTAFTINNATGAREGQIITFRIRNASGGVMGAITWTGYLLGGAFVNPANTKTRTITFLYDPTLGGWFEISRVGADL